MGVACGAAVKSRCAINWENNFPSCEISNNTCSTNPRFKQPCWGTKNWCILSEDDELCLHSHGQAAQWSSFLPGIKQRLLSFIFHRTWNEEPEQALLTYLAILHAIHSLAKWSWSVLCIHTWLVIPRLISIFWMLKPITMLKIISNLLHSLLKFSHSLSLLCIVNLASFLLLRQTYA